MVWIALVSHIISKEIPESKSPFATSGKTDTTDILLLELIWQIVGNLRFLEHQIYLSSRKKIVFTNILLMFGFSIIYSFIYFYRKKLHGSFLETKLKKNGKGQSLRRVFSNMKRKEVKLNNASCRCLHKRKNIYDN